MDEALTKAKAAAAADPRSVPAHYMLGSLYSTKGNEDEAIKSFTDVLKLTQSVVAALLTLARLPLASGAAETAGKPAVQAVRTHTDKALAALQWALTVS